MNRRAIALTAAILIVLIFDLSGWCGLVRNRASLPRWWGTVDDALAFVVGVGALVIPGLGHGNLDKPNGANHVSDRVAFRATTD